VHASPLLLQTGDGGKEINMGVLSAFRPGRAGVGVNYCSQMRPSTPHGARGADGYIFQGGQGRKGQTIKLTSVVKVISTAKSSSFTQMISRGWLL